MTDVTQLLHAIDAGEPKAAEPLLPLVYEELRTLAASQMAQERPGQTLQATEDADETLLAINDATYQNEMIDVQNGTTPLIEDGAVLGGGSIVIHK